MKSSTLMLAGVAALGVLMLAGKKAVAAVKGKTSTVNLSPEIVALAKKWAAARGLPVDEVLATIIVESGGKPKAWAKNAKEDSRGLMQVNVNAHAALLKSHGYTADDMFDPSKAIEVGTEIYKAMRAKVVELVGKSKVPQTYEIGTLTRLRYKGPAYVDKMLKAAKVQADTAHPYKDAEKAVANWSGALARARAIA